MLTHAPRTRWGGIADGRFRPMGFFRIEQTDGAFWLADPDGGRFLSKGVNTVRFDQDTVRDTDRIPYAQTCQIKYGAKSAWRAAAANRLLRLGMNTLGSWSDEQVASAAARPLALTPNLDLGASFAWRSGQSFPDVFDPAFERDARSRASELCAGRANDPDLVGWFIDNELRWGPDWRGADELLTSFLNLPAAAAGRGAAIAMLRERHRDIAAFNAVWRTGAQSWEELAIGAPIAAPYSRKPPYERDPQAEREADRREPTRAVFVADCDAFVAQVARRYFAASVAAIKGADPHHLVLGSRFAYVPQPGVVAAAARYVDVLSFNCYDGEPTAPIDVYEAGGKPCLIGEFSFRADDAGLPNTSGAGLRVATQTERARCFTHYVTTALRRPSIVGFHWFEHADQPAEGRFDGENSNYGIVSIDDRVYEELAGAMTGVNAEAEAIHAAASRPARSA